MNVKNPLMEASTDNLMTDVLMVLDCCCSSVGGNKVASLWGEVEFVATSTKEDEGVTSFRQTFKQSMVLCYRQIHQKAVREFSVQDVIDRINLNQDGSLEQHFTMFLIQSVGIDIPYQHVNEAGCQKSFKQATKSCYIARSRFRVSYQKVQLVID
ncbi:hypothetical protein MIR68_003169 [Amoeboaphelidium protococcarum]|nr:hypothetical protein MIR68_003169 [Amoeboaphelidium protococcarum]